MDRKINPQTTQPQYSNIQTLETKVYKCSKLKLTLFYVFFIVFLIILFFLVLAALVGGYYINGGIAILLFILSIIGTIVCARAISNNFIIKRIEINLNGVTFYKSRKNYMYYPLNTSFSSYVEVSTINGIYTGTSRSIQVPMANGKKKNIPLNSFSKNDFELAIADINNLRNYGNFDNIGNSVTPEVTVPNALQARFYVPKQQFLASNKASKESPIALALVIIIPSIIITFFAYFLNYISKEYIWLPTVCISVLILGCVFISNLHTKMNLEKCPECIELFTDHLKVDNDIFPINTITKITMTPASYNLSTGGMESYRSIKIFTPCGKAEYSLGQGNSENSKFVFSDYQMLMDSVKHWCFDHNVTYTEDLG